MGVAKKTSEAVDRWQDYRHLGFLTHCEINIDKI